VNSFEIGKYIRQPAGYEAFVPNPFPPSAHMRLPKNIALGYTEAVRLLGKLDGITALLPDRDWFLMMFMQKDASSSSQIEGTNATMMDVIEKQNVEPRADLPVDVDDIFHYIKALDYGMDRVKEFPLSLRFIRELHEKLMTGARETQFSYPGEFRTSQNWIGGTRPGNARFVPPPVHEMKRALDDLERFIHADDEYLPLIKAGLLHAQFETIHPFNDGNGRTGRMLITMFLWHEKILETPVLYLSSYFKKHQQLYYEKLEGYHRGQVFEWIDFFLEGVRHTANSAVRTCAGITELRERDMRKIQSLGKTSSASTLKILQHLYRMPIIGIADIVKWTGFSNKGGYNAIDRLVDMAILKPMNTGDKVYGQKWIYEDYIGLFCDEMEG
jgi:Fic family protein